MALQVLACLSGPLSAITSWSSRTVSLNHILPAVPDDPVCLFGYILNVSCCHLEIDMTQKTVYKSLIISKGFIVKDLSMWEFFGIGR